MTRKRAANMEITVNLLCHGHCHCRTTTIVHWSSQFHCYLWFNASGPVLNVVVWLWAEVVTWEWHRSFWSKTYSSKSLAARRQHFGQSLYDALRWFWGRL